jgi:branched-chain amino acid transport system permease protein
MGEFLGVVAQGIALGAVYALVAVGFVIVFRSTEVFNFAHGYTMVLAAYVATTLIASAPGVPFVVVVLIVLAIIGIGAAIVFLTSLRPLLGERLWGPAMVTVGLTTIIESVVGIAWNDEPRRLQVPWASHPFHVPGTNTRMSSYTAGTVVLCLIFFAMLIAFFRFSRAGRQMRAAAENPRLASWAGVNVTFVFVIAWVIAGVAAALAGIAIATNSVVSPSLADIGLGSIPAALLGGLDSVPGALLGAMVVGIAEVSAANYIGSDSSNLATFGLMLLVLVFRPSGLLGSKEVVRI